jgi:hypothetical protein
MKCLDDCHTYVMDTQIPIEEDPFWFPTDILVDNPPSPLIHFYEMREDGTKINGVTNEEVLKVLIHRLEALNKKMSCFENIQALTSLEGALSWFNARTENRIRRGVEGTHKP